MLFCSIMSWCIFLFFVQLQLVVICRRLCHLDVNNESGTDGMLDNSEPVTYCLQALLAIEVLLNPSSDTQMFVNELLMVHRLKVMSQGVLLQVCFEFLNQKMCICIQSDLVNNLIPYPELIVVQKFKIKALVGLLDVS